VKISNTEKNSYNQKLIATQNFGYFVRVAMISIPIVI